MPHVMNRNVFVKSIDIRSPGLSEPGSSTENAASPPFVAPTPPRWIGYARVSTEEQNLGLQIDALAGAGCIHTFQDHGISGSASMRPGLNEALAALMPGDVLVVWRLDRLGRSLSHLIGTIGDLETRGIGFRSLMENIDTKSSGGRLVFHMMAALAEFERSLISERTRAGLAAARARGVRLGRPARLTPTEADVAIRAVRDGLPVLEVAQAHGVHPRTLYRILERSMRRIV